MKFTEEQLAVYAVTSRRWLEEKSLCEAVRAALDGGATFIQIREKDGPQNLTRTLIKREACEICTLCHARNVPCVIDDDLALAVTAGADGVHVGQKDMAAHLVRQRIGKDKILGVTAQTVAEALRAEKDGADYIGVGAVFPTQSKQDATLVSVQTLQEICQAVSIPVVAIGGITTENVTQLAGTGIAGIAVISAIFAQKNISVATQALRQKFLNMRR